MRWILTHKIKVNGFLPEMFCIVVCELSFDANFLPFYWLRAWHWIIFCSSLAHDFRHLVIMGEDKTWTFHAWHPHFGTGHGSMNHFFCWRRNDNKQEGCLQPTRFDTFGWCLGVLITDIYSCLHDIPNARTYACSLILTWSVCSALWILFLFAVYFFP